MSFDPGDYPATRKQEEFERRQEKEAGDLKSPGADIGPGKRRRRRRARLPSS